MPIDDFDIIIVGGGPAGISTWLHLNEISPELAKRSLIIDKEIFPRDKLCGGAVGGWSANVFHELGLKLNIPFVKIKTIEFKYNRELLIMNKPGFFKIVKRKVFDYKLLKNAKKRGLQFHEGESFIDCINKNGELIIKTNINKYKAKTLVGADGALSQVRKKMNITYDHNLALAIEFFNPVNISCETEFSEKKAVFDFNPINSGVQGYLWHFPYIDNNTPSMNHGIGNFNIINNSIKPNLKKILQENVVDRNLMNINSKIQSYPIRWLSKTDIISSDNILLVGDAAGIEPATGGGIHLALSYGEVASNTIYNAFENNNFSYKQYRRNIDEHLLGKFIKKCTKFANEMYSGRLDPLDAMKEIFNIT